MRKRLYVPALAFPSLVALLYVSGFHLSRADAESEQSEPLDAASEFFHGKVVGVTLKGNASDQSNSWFTDVRLVTIEGRKFLVGKMYLPPTDEYKQYASFRDAVYGYSWEDVSRFRVMTPEQFDQYVNEWKKRSEDDSDSDVEKY